MIEDLTFRRRKGSGLHCHTILVNLGNPVTHSLRNSSLKLENLWNNQDLMFQSRNVEASKSSRAALLFDTYDRQGNDGKKDKIRSTRIKLVAVKRRTKNEPRLAVPSCHGRR